MYFKSSSRVLLTCIYIYRALQNIYQQRRILRRTYTQKLLKRRRVFFFLMLISQHHLTNEKRVLRWFWDSERRKSPITQKTKKKEKKNNHARWSLEFEKKNENLYGKSELSFHLVLRSWSLKKWMAPISVKWRQVINSSDQLTALNFFPTLYNNNSKKRVYLRAWGQTT